MASLDGRDELPAWRRRLNSGRDRPDEYVPWGGPRYDEPSLKADFPDGTRGIEWRFTGHRVLRRGPASTLEVDLTDTAYPLQVTLCYRVHDGFDVLERWATLRHRGDGPGPVVIRQAHAANWWLPGRDGWRLRYLRGGWGAETQRQAGPAATGRPGP
jgi:alpha-galactosidase